MIVCLKRGKLSLFLHKMKLISVCRTIFLFAILGILPAMLYAGDKEIYDKPLIKISLEEISSVFMDSIPVRRGGDKKEQDRPVGDIRQGENRPGENRPDDIRRVQEINGENQRIRQKSGIKQVPRSIPKLKPQAVTDRIPIRRPPMRIPKKGFGGIHF
ncbi:hypothetical protein SAMN05421813_105162 [Daejeonella rubra]|uniref:Uncharacterized protein n=2 Tax=Daejeonella rubra TaxID=990371 RepID=A0A1G9Q9U7_9SPHI|nr:hypothetical protein SAMN05421813_105162 [Daejeonella rubra]